MTTPFELDQERSSNQNCHSKGEGTFAWRW